MVYVRYYTAEAAEPQRKKRILEYKRETKYNRQDKTEI